MNSSDYRKEAREKLDGKWGIAIGISILFSLISLLFSFLIKQANEFYIFLLLLLVPLGYGIAYSFYQLYNGDTSNVFEFIIKGFQKFGRSWLIALHTVRNLLAPSLLFIISTVVGLITALKAKEQYSNNSEILFNSPALLFTSIIILASLAWIIISSYYYSMAILIAAEDEKISARDSVEKSKELMKGNRGKLFKLQLSFFGWIIVAYLITFIFKKISLGMPASIISLSCITTYLQFATISFYHDIK